MKQRKALLLGASGLVGGHCLGYLLADDFYSRVNILVRRELPIHHPKLVQHPVDFDRLENHAAVLCGDDVFCCLGTTIAKAGSREAFRRVDFGYPVKIAGLALKGGAKQFLLVSALGADAGSPIFYNRVKGQVEEAIDHCGFETLHIFRPALLTGKRVERRPIEDLGRMLSRLFPFVFSGPLKKFRPIAAEALAYAMVEIAREQWQGRHVFSSALIQSVYDQERAIRPD